MTDLIAQSGGRRDNAPAAAATVVRRRGEPRQRRGRRQADRGGESAQWFTAARPNAARPNGRRRRLAVDGVVEVDGVKRLIDKPPVGGHADLRKGNRIETRSSKWSVRTGLV